MRLSLLIALLVLCLQAPSVAAPGPYAPQGLYAVDVVRFPNGFRAVLKEQPDTRSVALRLVAQNLRNLQNLRGSGLECLPLG